MIKIVIAAAAAAALLALGLRKLLSCSDSTERSSSNDAYIQKDQEQDQEYEDQIKQVDLESEQDQEYEDQIKQVHLENGKANHNSDSRMIKIMSYNVWFSEAPNLRERMNAIGRLIRQHSPDVIFLQEVTPKIYKIFESSNWWKLYNCTRSAEKATRSGSCIVLSKLPVKYSTSIPLDDNSKTGREACVAWLDAGQNKSFLAVTSHLKSSVGNQSKKVCSERRVAEAKKVLNLLSNFPNVIFGGDMNWDEKRDKFFPLGDKWLDAWNSLRPEETGYTYDPETNNMLEGKSLRQRKRFDRFVCKLMDFKIINIEMIGMEAIPGLSHAYKNKVNPVYPSDHFGLLLTISMSNDTNHDSQAGKRSSV